MTSLPRIPVRLLAFLCVGGLLPACGESSPELEGNSIVANWDVPLDWGRAIALANQPTGDQYGTGGIIAILEDDQGTLRALPVDVFAEGGHAPFCLGAPPSGAVPTDTVSSSWGRLIGAANRPTGWRDGTGHLVLFFQAQDGTVRARTTRYPVAVQRGRRVRCDSPAAGFYYLIERR